MKTRRVKDLEESIKILKRDLVDCRKENEKLKRVLLNYYTNLKYLFKVGDIALMHAPEHGEVNYTQEPYEHSYWKRVPEKYVTVIVIEVEGMDAGPIVRYIVKDQQGKIWRVDEDMLIAFPKKETSDENKL